MVFVSNKKYRSNTLRYTLFHEYHEGKYLLGLLDETEARNRAREVLAAFKEQIPNVEDEFRKSWRKRHDVSHLYALLMELDLAQREMTPRAFLEHLGDALRKRL